MALQRIETDAIEDDAVTTDKINVDAVNSEHLVDGGVDDVHLATGIDAGKLINPLPIIDGSNLTGVAPTKTAVEALGIELPAANLTGTIHADRYTDTVYTHPTTAGNKHIPTAGATDQVLTYSSSGTASWADPAASGITEVDQWSLSTTYDMGSNLSSIPTANLYRNDNAFTKMGTGMTESSGVFTFPSTGLWQIWSTWSLYSLGVVIYFNPEVQLSTNSGTSFTARAYGSDGGFGNGNGGRCSVSCRAVLNITNASTFRVRFRAYASAYNITVIGSTSDDQTRFSFIRLGDSQ